MPAHVVCFTVLFATDSKSEVALKPTPAVSVTDGSNDDTCDASI